MFKEVLQSIVEKTEGSLGALIMGVDGLSVEKFFTEDGVASNLDVAAAELTSLIRSGARSGHDLNLGDLRELIVAYANVTFVLRVFGKDYFAVLALAPEGNIGRGRYELRKAELILAREFTV